MKTYKVADLFCGAGGSSTGAENAIRLLGRQMELIAINHWPVAIETHKKNHPSARHYIEDLSSADPVKLVPEGYLDLLMASPECRFYSRARGGRPVHDQARMNPWVIMRWLTSLDVRCLLVENVPEFVDWGPLLDDGRPDPKHKGEYFQAWYLAIQKAGYKLEYRFLNAADFGDATTRTRFFLIARKDSKSVRWPAPSHSPTGDATMVDHLLKWRAARSIIDWDNPGKSLLDDPRYLKRPLSPKTLKRIARGLQKFGGALAPLYINLLGLTGLDSETDSKNSPPEAFVMGKQGHATYRSVDQPIQSITTKSGHELIEPTMQPFVLGKQSGNPALRSIDQPIPTITAQGKPILVEPLAHPFILGQHSGSAPRDADKPIPTVMSDGAISLVEPTLIKYYSNGWDGDVSSVDSPVPTVTTKARMGLVSPTAKPFIINRHGENGGDRLHSIEDPAPTATTRGAGYLVKPLAKPFIVQNRIRPDGDRVYSIEKPITTVTGHGAGALVEPVLVEVNHSGDDSCRSYPTDRPLKTITTSRYSTALIQPIIEAVKNGDIDPRRLVLIDNEPYILDLRFRMLSNLELARAMGFTDSESTYEFCGNIGEVTRQIGNAVPVNLAKALVLAILK